MNNDLACNVVLLYFLFWSVLFSILKKTLKCARNVAFVSHKKPLWQCRALNICFGRANRVLNLINNRLIQFNNVPVIKNKGGRIPTIISVVCKSMLCEILKSWQRNCIKLLRWNLDGQIFLHVVLWQRKLFQCLKGSLVKLANTTYTCKKRKKSECVTVIVLLTCFAMHNY